MKLSEIANQFKLNIPFLDTEFENISINSNELLKESLFIAMKGGKSDGHQYIESAIQNGCKGIIAERAANITKAIPYLIFPDVQNKMQELSAFVYPGYKNVSNIIGVTGTNGKTTVSTLVRYLLEKSGKECGLMGTISCWDGKKSEDASHTTPPTSDIFRVLHQCAENKLQYCAMEVSSHALKQNRMGNIKVKSGIFTNLTQDHLDYHQSMDDYEKSKLKLLDLIDNNGLVVVINDNDFGKKILKVCKHKIITVGKEKGSDYLIQNIKMELSGSEFELIVNKKNYKVSIPLIGEHNIYNCMQACASLAEQGIALEKLIKDLKEFKGVAGRLEKVQNKGVKGPSVFVDYAHTPDAMDNVLKSVVPLKGKGKLWVVFGCGGDRDRTKRPLMAKSAEKYGDRVIVTSDNPRTENPDAIIEEIKKGFIGKDFLSIVDRRLAINHAIEKAAIEDMILLLGKGHEDYQIIGKIKHHFDDKKEAQKALDKRVGQK